MIIQNHINSYREQANLSITMYYDDACVICSTEAHNMQMRKPKKIHLVPVDEGVDELAVAGFSRKDAMTYMCMKDSYGNWYTHMDAVRLLYRTGGVLNGHRCCFCQWSRTGRLRLSVCRAQSL